MVKNGQEKQARKWLEDQWLTPTEVEEQIHPLSDQTSKSLEKIPKGLFPAQTKSTYEDVANAFKGKIKEKSPFVDYDTALEKDPRAMQVMQNRLSKFFLNNVDPSTSLSVLRDKIWREKDYDWRTDRAVNKRSYVTGIAIKPRSAKRTCIYRIRTSFAIIAGCV